MRFIILLLLLTTCALVSGCTTGLVLSVGVEKEDLWALKGGKVLTNSNGDLAIEIKANDHPEMQHTNIFVKKYILITREQLTKAAEEQKNWRNNNKITSKDKNHNSNLTLWGLKGFKLAPPPFINDEHIISQIESTYSIPYSHVKRNENISDEIYFVHENEIYELPSDPRPLIPGYEYERTLWWGYPFRILIIPAFAIDVVTSPIQYFMFKQKFGGSS